MSADRVALVSGDELGTESRFPERVSLHSAVPFANPIYTRNRSHTCREFDFSGRPLIARLDRGNSAPTASGALVGSGSMPRAQTLGNDRITTIRFRTESTGDHVTARLLEAVRRTGLSLLSLDGDGRRAYPFSREDPTQSASSWCAELFWRESARDLDLHLEVFRCRAERFLDCHDGIHVESRGPHRRASRRRVRNGEAFDRTAPSQASLTSPGEL